MSRKIHYSSFLLAAAAGFVLSSIFLSLFVETGVQTSLTPQDTRWIGNWWLGIAIAGGLGAFWSPWLFGFPKEFPLTRARREEGNTTDDVGYKDNDDDHNHHHY